MPEPFTAVTDTEYVVPGVSPVIEQLVDAVVQLNGDPDPSARTAVAVYDVTLDPPEIEGAAHDTRAPVVAGFAETLRGGEEGMVVTRSATLLMKPASTRWAFIPATCVGLA